jgi:hypothetical protein
MIASELTYGSGGSPLNRQPDRLPWSQGDCRTWRDLPGVDRKEAEAPADRGKYENRLLHGE